MTHGEEEAWAWSMRDEGQYQFLRHKYHDRKGLADDCAQKRKLADKSETVDGKPNPEHPRLQMHAEMAQLRYEMSYIVDKNAQLETQIEALSYLCQRVDILEGAYGHVKLVAETAKVDYSLVAKALKSINDLHPGAQNAHKEKRPADAAERIPPGAKSEIREGKAKGG